MLRFKFTQLSIATAWALHYLPLWNSPANKGRNTIRVSRKKCGWNNNSVKKVNLAKIACPPTPPPFDTPIFTSPQNISPNFVCHQIPFNIRLYTHTKYYNISCVSWAVIEFWCHGVAFQTCVMLNFVYFFNLNWTYFIDINQKDWTQV